jgi:hypothetical protein
MARDDDFLAEVNLKESITFKDLVDLVQSQWEISA